MWNGRWEFAHWSRRLQPLWREDSKEPSSGKCFCATEVEEELPKLPRAFPTVPDQEIQEEEEEVRLLESPNRDGPKRPDGDGESDSEDCETTDPFTNILRAAATDAAVTVAATSSCGTTPTWDKYKHGGGRAEKPCSSPAWVGGCQNAKTLGKLEAFKGEATDFPDWSFIFNSYVVCINPHFAGSLERAESSKLPMPNRFLKESEKALSTQLYFALVMLLRNRALDIAYNAGVSEGLEAYRRLHQQYHPKVASRYVGSLSAILATKFGNDRHRSSKQSLKSSIRW